MFDLFIGEGTRKLILTFAIIAAVLVVLILFAKFKPIQALFSAIIYVGLIFSGIISFGHINAYYSTRGDVIGEISSLFKKNQVDIVVEKEEIKFDFKNVVLMKNPQGKYSASMTSNTILKLDDDETYFIYVNGEPCTTVKCESKDIYATYNYAFFERENGGYKVKKDDQMTFYFALYEKYSYLYIEVENGTETSGLWNAYFNKNDFSVKIVKVGQDFYKKAEYKKITLKVNNELYKQVTLKKGSDYFLPTDVTVEDTKFRCWLDSSGNEVSKVTNIQEDLTFNAKLSKYIDFESSNSTAVLDVELMNNSTKIQRFTITIKNYELSEFLRHNKIFQKIELSARLGITCSEMIEFTTQYNLKIEISSEYKISGTFSNQIDKLVFYDYYDRSEMFQVPMTFECSFDETITRNDECEVCISGTIFNKNVTNEVKEEIPSYDGPDIFPFFYSEFYGSVGAKVYD